MRKNIIFVLLGVSLVVAGSALGATTHHHRGYHAYASTGHGYRSTCARFNARLAAEPGAIAIQDQDLANSLGGRLSTCH